MDRSLTLWAKSTASSLGLITGQGLDRIEPKALAFLRGQAASTIRAIDKVAPPRPRDIDELRAAGLVGIWPDSSEDRVAWVTPEQRYALDAIAEDYGHGPVTRNDVGEIIRLAALAMQEGE